MDLKPGMKIPIYKIINHGWYPHGTFTPGTYRAGLPYTLIHKVLKNKKQWNGDDGYALMFSSEAKMVGCMVIKKIKDGTK